MFFLWFDVLSAVGDCGERSIGISASKGICIFRRVMEETGTLLGWKRYFLWQEIATISRNRVLGLHVCRR